MIGPESGATLRSDLRDAAHEFDQENGIATLIGQRVLPVYDTPDAEGGYPVVRRDGMRKMPETGRAPGAGFNRGDWGWGRDSYDCIENAYEIPCDRKQAAKYRRWIDYEIESAMMARAIIHWRHEIRVAAAVLNTSTFTAVNAAVAWATVATSTPLADIDAGANVLEDAVGVPREQLSLILPRIQWQYLRNSDEVLEVLKAWDSGIQRREAIKNAVVAAYLGIKEILIGRSSYDTANEGIAESTAQIWGVRYGMLAKLGATGMPLKTLCLGRTMRWTDRMPEFVTLESYGEEGRDSEIVRARQFTDEVIVCDEAGYLIDCTAAS